MNEENKNPEEKDVCKNCSKSMKRTEMSEEDKYSCCQNYRDVNQAKMFSAERRTCELADEFTKLEVQIAVVLFGIVGIFATISDSHSSNFLLSASDGFRRAFLAVLMLLIGSLTFGLFHIKIREYFWEGHYITRISRGNKWDEAIKRTTSYEEAMAFHFGTAEAGNTSKLSKSPNWTWIFQTLCLGAAVIILLVLVGIVLF